MTYETFTQELAAVRSRGAQFQQRARQAVEGEALLPEALEELSTALEELRVTEEEVRVQNEQLAEAHQSVEAQRDHYRELFQLAPVAYLVTDRVGLIREANQQTASLLGVARVSWSVGPWPCTSPPRTAGGSGTGSAASAAWTPGPGGCG